MKKYILSILAVASVLFVGCNKEVAPATSGRVVKVSAALDVTKVAGTNEGKYAWEAGDVIGVWTGSQLTPFTIEASSVGTGVGVFTGTLPADGVINENSYAVYPYNEGDSMEGTVYTSKYNESNWDFKSYIPLAAKPTATTSGSTTVASYMFSHLTALARLELKNIPAEATSIFLESNTQLFLLSAKADLAAEYPKFAAEATADYCFVDLPEHTGAISELTVYVPLVLGEKADPKFRFTLFATPAGADFGWGDEMEKATYNHYGYLNTGGYINRGDLYVLPTVTF